MENNDPTLIMAGKIGELTGVISGLSVKIDDLRDDMKEKISKDTCDLMINKALGVHISKDHKASKPPQRAAPSEKDAESSARIVINGTLVKRFSMLLGGVGGGGLGIWAILEKFLGQ